MRIVLMDPLDLTANQISDLRRLGDVTIYPDLPSSEDEAIERARDADAIVPFWTTITRRLIESTPALRYIVAPGVGYEWIDVAAATERGIPVMNCPTYNIHAVVELTLALMLAAVRQIPACNEAVRREPWQPGVIRGRELRGRALLLVGYGNIARGVASLAQGFGMRVSYVNSRSLPSELDEQLQTADIVSLHTPLNDKTEHLLDERRLRLMKRGAILINTARGAIVDEAALASVLREGHLSAAAIDVFGEKPIRGPSAALRRDLLSSPRLIATPYVGYNTDEAYQRLGDELLANLRSCVAGPLRNVVNPEAVVVEDDAP